MRTLVGTNFSLKSLAGSEPGLKTESAFMKFPLIPRLDGVCGHRFVQPIAWIFAIVIGSFGPGAASSDTWTRGPVSSYADSSSLALGDASGPSGTTVTVPLSLDNLVEVKGIQADIVFDGARAFFSGVDTTALSADMVVEAEAISPNQVRLILFYSDDNQLAIGSGDIAVLTFTLQGPGGESTDLTLSDMILSDPEGNSLEVKGSNGQLSVGNPLEAPSLQISVLQNPGRVRTMRILVKIANGSGSAPTVSASGSSVEMANLGQGIWSGSYSATQASDSTVISALDTNIQGPGDDHTTVSFQ